MRRRLVGVAVAIVALVVAFVWWNHGDDAASIPAHEVAAVHHEHDSMRSQLARIAWLGQRGVADRAVAGIVIGDQGPIAGATVRLATHVVAREQRFVTDAEGRFDFGAQLAGTYVVAAEARGFAPTTLALDLRDPAVVPDHVKLALHPCEAWVYGTVRDTGGGTVARARVALEVGAEMSAGVDADDGGAFELCVPIGQRSMIARADGYASASAFLFALGKIRHDFTLGPEATIAGRVITADDHAPVANAIVALESSERAAVEAATDDSGKFTFEGLSPGRYRLSANAEHLGTEHAVDVITVVGKPGEVTLELTPTFTVSGKLIDATSASVGGLSVALLGPSWAKPANAIAQSDGTFEIAHVRSGDFDVVVGRSKPVKPDPASVKVTTADVKGLTFQVERPASVSGRVTRNGLAVDGVDVRASGASTRSDADGKFTLANVRPGTFPVYAESERLGAFTSGPEVTVAAGEQKRGVELDINLAGSISGIVVDQDGAPVPGASVRFSLVGGADGGVATTHEDGRFLARGLSGGGVYTCMVSRDGYGNSYRAAGSTHLAPIAVANGNTHVDGVTIKIRVDHLSIAGHVVDASGSPVADVKVVGTGRYGHGAAVTDATGAFRLADLSSGTYSLQATSSDSDAVLDNVVAGRGDVVLTLAATGTVDVTVTGFTDRPEVTLGTRSDTRTATVVGSVFHFDRVPAGSARVSAVSATDSDDGAVVVTAGVTAKVALRARGYGTVVGTFRDTVTHAPIAGAVCFVYMGDSSRRGSQPPPPSDATGAIRLDHVRAGTGEMSCSSDQGYYAYRSVTVTSGKTTTIELDGNQIHQTKRVDPGLTIAVQLDEAVVGSVTTGGPAERAGVRVGDVVKKVGDGGDPQDAYAIYSMIAYDDAPQLKLTLERDDKQLVVTLSLATTP